jgi:hypothetical protein
MPHALDLEAQEDSEAIIAKGRHLIGLCSRMLQNISSRVICEYVFNLGDGRVAIFAGPGSAQTFRNNFYYRLAEAFSNFEWLHKSGPQQFPIAEYRTYEQFYLALKKETGHIPNVVEEMYKRAEAQLTNDPQKS